MTPVVEGRAIVRDYHVPGNMLRRAKSVRAVKGIDFSVQKGKTLAIVGESGSGKSTLARIIALIDAPSQGELLIEGQRVDINASRPGPELRSKVQMVFQNPYGSLNPRQKIGDVLTETLVINTDVPAAERRDRARFPRPDEPVSALDLSVQAQVLNLLADLQDELGLTYVFVSHDLSVVRYIADEVMVISEGEAVEQGSRDAIFANPTHPYTRQLFAATPVTDTQAIRARVARRKAARQAAAV